ncbi:hypothetical protein [Pseudoalteromonas sp. OOF1S-7]|uniref:hypothetical protein n=1 Tax=Pseudoalteromonas sp. OOF1S-7 TaxID=2917757 RepID=UPI001EF6872C|nr:hypothetical protein [Pseudoalteromonas sp. OOF1S-7]MCG7535594.1 hypothetical protein [Pseudoalteromonas sp. OOF1S-7]
MKNSATALSTLAIAMTFATNANTSLDHIELEPAGTVTPSSYSISLNDRKEARLFARHTQSVSANSATTITPQCQTLSTGNLYTHPGLNTGATDCYHFEITERGKTTALLLNQEAGNNIDLSLIRHNEDDTYTALGLSNNTGTADEAVVALTEPGHYYWFFEAQEGNAKPFGFGAIVATQLDGYEFNDTVATATILDDKQHHINANMDSATDVDLYKFTAVRGQDVVIHLNDNKLDEWVIEVYNNGWQTLPNNRDNNLSNLQANQDIYVRVIPNLNLPVKPDNFYNLTFGTKVASTSDYFVTGESNVNRVTYAAFREADATYATTQAYRKVTWGITLKDSTGHPVEGAKANLRFDQDVRDLVIEYVDHIEEANSEGRVSGVVNVGSCFSELTLRHTEYSFGYKNIWDTDLVHGVWRLEIPYSVGLGIGGPNVEYVVFGHLCDQDLVSSNPS